MNGVTGPISIGLGSQSAQKSANNKPAGIARNISFNNIHATVVKPVPLRDAEFSSKYNPGEEFSCITLNAMDDVYLENITFNDVHIKYPGGGTAEQGAVRDVPKIAGEYYQMGVPPAYALYARNVRALTMSNMRFEMAEPDKRPAVVFDNVHDAAINGLGMQGQKEAESLLRFSNVTDVLITALRVLTPVSLALLIEGPASNNLKIDGGDLSKATQPVALAAGVRKDAVKVRD